MARVGSDFPAQWCQPRVQNIENHARLDNHSIGTDRDDPSKVTAEIDDEAGAEGLTRQTCSCAPGMKWDRIFAGVTNQSRQVFDRSGHDDPQRIDLVETRVVRVGGSLDRLEEKFATEDASEVVMNPSPDFVHDTVASSRSMQVRTREGSD
jgi:hypothetical protein